MQVGRLHSTLVKMVIVKKNLTHARGPIFFIHILLCMEEGPMILIFIERTVYLRAGLCVREREREHTKA